MKSEERDINDSQDNLETERVKSLVFHDSLAINLISNLSLVALF
jgi:hypothetical protein